MAPILLKIYLIKTEVTKALQFDESMTVYDACRTIQEKVPEATPADSKEASTYGLFLPDEDPTKGFWLQAGRPLKYYNLKSGQCLEFRTRQRPLRVKTLDGAVRTVLVDDSHAVSEITRAVAARIDLHNPQEFSFTVGEEGTLRKHVHDKKLETLQRELHTDDQLNWLDPKKTLREHGLLDETVVLTLRKKFFFSDENVNANDPVQLRLLYVQCHEAVLDSTYPVTREEAIQLAALQSQIHFGNYDDRRFKKGFLKPTMSSLLPLEYRKEKKIEQAIFDEHRKLFGMSEENAKFRYIEHCRSLRTYGVSFFVVKEKVPGRNKLHPVLVGINRESVMRMDMKTKEVLKTWPLTTVCSYAATPNSFSLNFGAYSGSVYNVKTTDGEAIVQLLDGYIDLILQTKRALSFEVPEDIPAIEESIVEGKTPTALKMTSGGTQHAEEGTVATLAEGKKATTELPAVQKALQEKITDVIMALTNAYQDMSTAAELPTLGKDKASAKWKQMTVDVSRHKLGAHLTTVLASSATVITLSNADVRNTDFAALGSAVSTIGTNMHGVKESSRLLAALSTGEEDSGNILEASRSLANALKALLGAAQPEGKNIQRMLSAAGDIAESSNNLLRIVGATAIDSASVETAKTLMAVVAASAATLTAEARKLGQGLDDPGLQIDFNDSVTHVESSVEVLTAIVNLLSPHLENTLCQEGLLDACKALAAAIEKLCLGAQAIFPGGDDLKDLAGAAATVTDALNALLKYIKEGSELRKKDQVEECYEVLLAAARALQTPSADAKELLRDAKALAEATKSLMHALKAQADQDSDVNNSQRLHGAVKELAGATSRMAHLAKGVAAKKDLSAHAQLSQEAEHILSIATTVVGPSLRKISLQRLQLAAKQVASASVQLIAASEGAKDSNKNETSQTELLNHCKLVSEQVGLMVQALQASVSDLDDAHLQLELINTAKAAIPPTGRLVAAAKKAVPTVSDHAVALQLGRSAKHTAARLGALRSAIGKASEFCGSLVIDTAIRRIQELTQDLTHAQQEAQEGSLHPLPGQTIQACSQQLVTAIKSLEVLKPQLVTAASDQNSGHAGFVAREMVNSLMVVVQASSGLAALSDSKESQDVIFCSALEVLEQSEALMAASKLVLEDTATPDDLSGLLEATRKLTKALMNLLNCLPGQMEFERAIRAVQEAASALDPNKLPDVGETPYSALGEGLTQAAAAFTSAIREVLAATKGTPAEQGVACGRFTEAHQGLMTAGMELAAATEEKDKQSKLIGHLSLISGCSSRFLTTAKLVSADGALACQNQLTTIARSLVDAVNKLLRFSSDSQSGVKECESALRDLEAVAPLLEAAVEPVSELSYYRCIEAVIKSLKVLTASLSDLTGKGSESLGDVVQKTSLETCEIVEATAQAAYVVGIADLNSTAASAVVIDQVQLSRSTHLVSIACQSLASSSSGKEEVIAAADTISKHTNALCEASKLAATRTTNPLAKKEFLKAVKTIADSNATLLKSIDVLSGDLTDENRQTCVSEATLLVVALEQLGVFASSPEFTPSPARISQEGITAQAPILKAGRDVHSTSVAFVGAVKAHITDPDEPDESLTASARAVTDAVASLLKTLRSYPPGLRECGMALAQLESVHSTLKLANHRAVDNSLQMSAESTLQGFMKQAVSVASDVKDEVKPLATAAKRKVIFLGEKVTLLASYFPSLAQASIGAASKTNISELQQKILDHAITVVESARELVTAAQMTKGNPRDRGGHKLVDKGARHLQEALDDFTTVVGDACSESGLISGMADEITKAMYHLEEEHVEDSDKGSLAEYQTTVLEQCEALARAAHQMVLKGSSSPETLATLRQSMCTAYTHLVVATRGILANVEDAQSSSELFRAVHDLGATLLELLFSSAEVQLHPEDVPGWHALAHNEQTIKRKVSQILTVVQTCGCGSGTLACLKAVASIRELVGDIDVTTSLLSTAGLLNLGRLEPGEAGTDKFSQHRQKLFHAAKDVANATEVLVQSVNGSQEEMATAATHAVETLKSQAELVKQGGAALPSEEQLLLLTGVKDVAHAVGGVLEARGTSSPTDEPDHPAAGELLEMAAKRAEAAGSQLLKTVSSIDETGNGLQVLQNTIDYIDYGTKDFDTQVPWPKKEATIGDLQHCTKTLSMASVKAVEAGTSLQPAELAMCAGMGRNAMSELLGTASALAWSVDTEEDKTNILTAALSCASSFKALMEHLLQTAVDPSDENKELLPSLADEVSNSVEELLEAVDGTSIVD